MVQLVEDVQNLLVSHIWPRRGCNPVADPLAEI